MISPVLTYKEPPVEIEVPEIDYSNIITEDGAPVENIVSEQEMFLLKDTLYVSWRINGKRPKFVAMTDVGLFYNPEKPAVVPDVMVSLGVSFPEEIKETKDKSYFIWRYGKPPEIVVEIISNNKGHELDEKRQLYAELGIAYYIVHDPLQCVSDVKLHVFERHGNEFVRTTERWFAPINLGVTLWSGTYKGMTREWLRWVDEDGNLLLTGEEATELANQRAEDERQRAEDERQRADSERERAERLLAKFRELGIDPADI